MINTGNSISGTSQATQLKPSSSRSFSTAQL